MDLKAHKSRYQELENFVRISHKSFMQDEHLRRFKKEKLPKTINDRMKHHQ
jgi:hypothetical protein